MPISRKEFEKSVDKSKSLCLQVKELFEKNKDTAYTFQDLTEELTRSKENYSNNIIGYFDAGLDLVQSILLIPCLTSLENSGFICQKRVDSETYYTWCYPNIKFNGKSKSQ